jgi:hypothetical protein
MRVGSLGKTTGAVEVGAMTTPTLFSKPFDGQLVGNDVATLLGWPESDQVEFKKDIPERNGGLEPWY